MVVTAASFVIAGSQDRSEFRPVANTNQVTATLTPARMADQLLGSGKTFGISPDVTYSISSTSATTISTTTINSVTYAQIGVANANAKAGVISLSFSGNQPWSDAAKRIDNVSIFTYLSGSGNTPGTFSSSLASVTGVEAPLTNTYPTTTTAPTYPISYSFPSNIQFRGDFSFSLDSNGATSAYFEKISITYSDVVITRVPTSLEITTPPSKVSYLPGEVFSTSGMVVKANFATAPLEELNFTDYTVLPINVLSNLEVCNTATFIRIAANEDNNVFVDQDINVSGGGFYSGLNLTRGFASLGSSAATRKFPLRVGDAFDPSLLDVFGYLACLSDGAIQTERLFYQESPAGQFPLGYRGFKVLNAAKTTPLPIGTTFESSGPLNAFIVYEGVQGPNPNSSGTLSYDGVSGVLATANVTFEIEFTIDVLAADADVPNTATTSPNTFIGANENNPVESLIGGINWTVFLTSRAAGTGIIFETTGDTRGTGFVNASSVTLISKPYNFYGDVLVKSLALSLSTTNTTASISVRVGSSSTVTGTLSATSNQLKTPFTFSEFNDTNFGLTSIGKNGYAYGHIIIEITGLIDTVYINEITVESNTNQNVRNAIQFATYLQDIETCDVTNDDISFMTSFYQNIRIQDENEALIANPYLVNVLIFDKESLNRVGSKYDAFVSAENKYQYITLNGPFPPAPQPSNPFTITFSNQGVEGITLLTLLPLFISLVGFGLLIRKKLHI